MSFGLARIIDLSSYGMDPGLTGVPISLPLVPICMYHGYLEPFGKLGSVRRIFNDQKKTPNVFL